MSAKVKFNQRKGTEIWLGRERGKEKKQINYHQKLSWTQEQKLHEIIKVLAGPERVCNIMKWKTQFRLAEDAKNKQFGGLVKWLCCYEYLLFLQKPWLQIPAPAWQPTAMHNSSSSRASYDIFCRGRHCIHGVHTHTHRHNTHTHSNNSKKLKQSKNTLGKTIEETVQIRTVYSIEKSRGPN